MKTHDYTWKYGLEFSSSTKLRTNKPLTEDTILIDLYDGHRYRVQAIYAANPSDKEWSFLPDTVVHALPLDSLSSDELTRLRVRANYMPDECSHPLADVVFFPVSA